MNQLIERTFTHSANMDELLEQLIAEQCNKEVSIFKAIMMDEDKYFAYAQSLEEMQEMEEDGYSPASPEFMNALDEAFADEAPAGTQLSFDFEGEKE